MSRFTKTRLLALSALAAVFLAGLWKAGQPVAARQAAPAVGRRMPVPPRLQVRAWSPTSSGPAALGTVLNTYGLKRSALQLEQLGNAVGRKALLGGLETGAVTAKFRARVVQVDAASLPAQPLPAVAEWADGEYRVLIDTRDSSVLVYDPVSGARGWLTAQELAAGWTGKLLLIHPIDL
jgi:ABC-type bacteriocin/lantibiotic exporter with double-glycine peptidase domain